MKQKNERGGQKLNQARRALKKAIRTGDKSAERKATYQMQQYRKELDYED